MASQPPQSQGLNVDKEWLKSIPSYLKIGEMSIDLFALICAAGDTIFAQTGGVWVLVVITSALITTATLFLFHLLKVIDRYKLPGNWLFIEFINYIVHDVMIFTAAIVAAEHAGRSSSESVVVATIFTFLALFIYGVDTFFMFRNWNEDRLKSTPNTATTDVNNPAAPSTTNSVL